MKLSEGVLESFVHNIEKRFYNNHQKQNYHLMDMGQETLEKESHNFVFR